ncbi:MAG: hypothetical protein ACI3YT_11330 [Prevotella sp.]
MKNKFYSRVAAVIMAVIGQIISIPTFAQQMVPVTELQTRDDGTQVQVEKMVEVPEKSAEEVAAAKRKAATVTAEEDDLQYFLNNLAMTRAGESTVVIDLSTFGATTRETTLEVNNGLSLKFTNGTLKRGTGLAEGSPMIRISNGTEVEFDETVTISGENLETNGEAVVLRDASLKTAAWIGNMHYTESSSYFAINSSSSSSQLEITGGTIDGISHHSLLPLVISGGSIKTTYVWEETDVILSGEETDLYISLVNKTSKLCLKSTVKAIRFYDYNDLISEGYIIATGYDGYQLTESDLQTIKVKDKYGCALDDYEKRLEGNSIVMRKKDKNLQTAINNAADGIEATFNISDYDELTKGILIPTGKKIKLTATSNVTLASNFTGDYIFRTEGDAQLDITIPGFSGYSSTSLPKYGFVAGYAESKIQVNQLGTNTLSIPNTLLAVEKGGTIDCYANISTKGIYNAAGGTMNIYSESGEVETFTGEGGTVNITGPVKFYSTFTSLGTASLLSENVTSLAKLVLGKQSSMTFTSKWVKPTSLNISFKDNDYVLDQTYITFESSTTMLSGFENVRFSLQDGHSAYLDNDSHQLSIEEVDYEALAQLDAMYKEIQYYLEKRDEDLRKLSKKIDNYYNQGLLTEIEYQNYIIYIKVIYDEISVANQYLSTYQGLRPVFYGKKSVAECHHYVAELEDRCVSIHEVIEKLEYDVENLVSSHKKTFTNTDDLQDYLNSLAEKNATTPDNPAKVSVDDGTELDNVEIPEGTYVEIDVTDKDGGSGGDDLQAYLNGLITVGNGASLRLNGNYVVRGESTSVSIIAYGTIDIYATIILEGTKTEVVHVYNGGTVNWRGNMTSGKIVNEGTFNMYSGTTDYVENRGTAQHYAGICHHIVNHETYYLKGGSIDATNTDYSYAFENYGTAHLTGGTIISTSTLIINYVNSTTYIDGVNLDDSNATTTVISYSDFYIRGDYSPKHIVLDNGVRINFITVWTVRWHITFIDNRTTIRKVIFQSDEFDVNDDFIQFIDFDFPDGYRWYYNATEKGIELRDTKVYDSDDLQAFLDRLAKSSGSASDPVILDGDNHTVDVTMDANGLFEFPGNSNVEVRNIIFRFVSTTSHKTWYIPSGSTVILNNVTLDGGEDEYGNDNAEMMVDGGQLFVNNVVFINLHLNINCTIYICSPLSSRIYLVYDNNGEIVDGTHVAEGRMGYVLTEADLDKFGYYDYYGSGKLWKFVLAGNAIELYQEISGINTLSENNHPRVYVDGVGKLNITGVSLDAQCFIYSSEGALVKAGTVAEVTASGGMLARGCYVLKVGTTTVKFVR